MCSSFPCKTASSAPGLRAPGLIRVCGIAGLLDLAGRPADPGMLEQMARTIRHRGPDDSGIHVDGAAGLANVRLAVIDTSTAGHQPMRSADGRYVISYNGELYNFRELAAELAERRRSFESRTDTEVVLRAYEEWGPACLDRFNGMFAFAIWDTHERELFIARDRLGIKPVYYATIDGKFAFGSEVKALIPAGTGAAVSAVGLAEYFTFQNILSDATLFDGVRMLPAGHFLQIREHQTRSTSHALLGSRVSPGRVRARGGVDESGPRRVRAGGEAGNSSAMCRSGATSPAASTRARSHWSQVARFPA